MSSYKYVDVTCNSRLLEPAVRQSHIGNYDETRHMLLEMQGQLKHLKQEIDRKDSVITEMTTARGTPSYGRRIVGFKEDSCLSLEGEMSALHSRCATLDAELRAFQAKVAAKDENIAELKKNEEALRQENSRLAALVERLQHHMRGLENAKGSLEELSGHSMIVAETLERESREASTRIQELESRANTHLNEREQAERKAEQAERKWRELQERTFLAVGEDLAGCNPGDVDGFIRKVVEVVSENSLLRGKLMTMRETNVELEKTNHASRETIQRLVGEIDRTQGMAHGAQLNLDQLKAERDAAMADKERMTHEVDTLKERLETSQRAWRAAREELDSRHSRMSTVDGELHQMEYQMKASQQDLRSFKEQLATLLSDGNVRIEANEDMIKERVRAIVNWTQQRAGAIDTLDDRMKALSLQLQEQVELRKEAERKQRRAEGQMAELEDRLRGIDGEISSQEVIRDGLRQDKLVYLSFMERLANIMGVDRVSADIGIDMNAEMLLARAEQLGKGETDSLHDRTTHIYGLQRKLKMMKEQLSSKDLHLEMMRRKLVELEEERGAKSIAEREREDTSHVNKKLRKQIERLQQQLGNTQLENQEVKAQLAETTNLRVRVMEQDRVIESHMAKISELERLRKKQASKIGSLRDEVHHADHEVGERSMHSDQAVFALSNELRSVKLQVEDISKRERQLADFREVIARMLGLEITNLAVPDYEIISRLENVIAGHPPGVYHAYPAVPVAAVHQGHAVHVGHAMHPAHAVHAAHGGHSAHPVPRPPYHGSCESLDEGFRDGYQAASSMLRTTSPRRAMHKTKHQRTRSKSTSPTRNVRIDPNCY